MDSKTREEIGLLGYKKNIPKIKYINKHHTRNPKKKITVE